MGIAFTIVTGLVLMTIFASGFDFLSKRRNRLDNETKQKVAQLEQRLAIMESAVSERDEKISQLETDISFVNKLIEKK